MQRNHTSEEPIIDIHAFIRKLLTSNILTEINTLLASDEMNTIIFLERRNPIHKIFCSNLEAQIAPHINAMLQHTLREIELQAFLRIIDTILEVVSEADGEWMYNPIPTELHALKDVAKMQLKTVHSLANHTPLAPQNASSLTLSTQTPSCIELITTPITSGLSPSDSTALILQDFDEAHTIAMGTTTRHAALYPLPVVSDNLLPLPITPTPVAATTTPPAQVVTSLYPQDEATTAVRDIHADNDSVAESRASQSRPNSRSDTQNQHASNSSRPSSAGSSKQRRRSYLSTHRPEWVGGAQTAATETVLTSATGLGLFTMVGPNASGDVAPVTASPSALINPEESLLPARRVAFPEPPAETSCSKCCVIS